MIYKIVTVIFLAVLGARAVLEFIRGLRPSLPEQRNDIPEHLSYEQIDDVTYLRERLRVVEDLITSCEAYAAGEHEKSFCITWHDASGVTNTYQTFVNGEFLRYLYHERHVLRSSLRHKISLLKN